MRLSLKLAVLTALNILTAFAAQWIVITELGAGIETDALFAAMALPQMVLVVISGSLMHVLVPILSGENEQILIHDAWAFLILIAGLFSIIALVLYFSAGLWVPLTLPGFNESALNLTISLARIQIISIIFYAINGVQWAVYYARKQFLWAELITLLASVASLLIMAWAVPRLGVIAAAYINTFKIALQTIGLSPIMGKIQKPNLNSVSIKKAWSRIKPLLIGTTIYKADPLLDKFLLSTSTSGFLSLFHLGNQIYGAINQIIDKAISAPLAPEISRLHKLNEEKKIKEIIHTKLLLVFLICTGIILIGLQFGHVLLGLLIGHGNVNAHNVDQLWWILVWLSGMFLGASSGQICSSFFYAKGDTKTTVRVGIPTYLIYTILKIILYHQFGIKGLAIATSTYYMAEVFILLYLIEFKADKKNE